MTLKIEKLNEKLLCVAAVAKAGWTRSPLPEEYTYIYTYVAHTCVCVHVKV